MPTKVAVVTDSAACLPQELAAELGIHVVPMEMSTPYLDGVDISPREFYLRLAQCEKLPTTSAPRPTSFIEAFATGAARAESVLCLTLLSAVSATNSVAVAAAQAAREARPGATIEVMDTGTAAGGQGLVVLAAARAAAAGADLSQVKAEAQRVMQGVHLVAFLDTLHYLWMGGRVPRIAAWAGSALKLKPMMELRQGVVRPLGWPRTRQRAMERLLSLVRQSVGDGPMRANVMHALAQDDALALRERLLSEFNCLEALVSEFTPVMGTHTGPGLLGIAFHRDEHAT